jgi:hypothetical protein
LKLVPDEPTPLEKMLLDASRNELPSAEHKAKLRAALGIGLPLSLPPPPASTAVPTAPAASSPTAAPVAVATQSTVAAKVAVGVGALAVAGVLWFTQGSEPSPVVPAKAPAAAQAVQAPAPVVAPAAEAQPAVSPLPPVESPAAVPARPGPAKSDSSASVADDLSEQIRLIEAARAGVASHDAKAALSALNTYSSKFPRGSFGQEATVLRIRALDQSGDSTRATAMAKSFVARFPNSPHVARLKPIAERGASR